VNRELSGVDRCLYGAMYDAQVVGYADSKLLCLGMEWPDDHLDV